jgi:hypothetical protein
VVPDRPRLIVREGKAVGVSFGRSRELVRGHGWSVFGVVIITALASAIVGPFLAIALTVMYFHLRDEPPASEPDA